MCMPGAAEVRRCWISWNWSCRQVQIVWESNLGPLQKQTVLSTRQPSPQTNKCYLKMETIKCPTQDPHDGLLLGQKKRWQTAAPSYRADAPSLLPKAKKRISHKGPQIEGHSDFVKVQAFCRKCISHFKYQPFPRLAVYSRTLSLMCGTLNQPCNSRVHNQNSVILLWLHNDAQGS